MVVITRRLFRCDWRVRIIEASQVCCERLPRAACVQASARLLWRCVLGVTDSPILLWGSGPSATHAGPASNWRGVWARCVFTVWALVRLDGQLGMSTV